MPSIAALAHHVRQPAVVGVGSGIVGAATVLAKSGPSGLGPFLPSAPLGVGGMIVPFVSLLALVGPTGLTFPCWVSDARSPGGRAWRWVRRRLRA
jgi:hypothetical protein